MNKLKNTKLCLSKLIKIEKKSDKKIYKYGNILYLGERDTEIIYIFNLFTSGNFIVDLSIRLDSLTTTMFIVVCSVSACVHLYSIGYMSDDPSKERFMGYLSLFTFK